MDFGAALGTGTAAGAGVTGPCRSRVKAQPGSQDRKKNGSATHPAILHAFRPHDSGKSGTFGAHFAS
ncbi:MAG: hypothetical protein IPK22_10985 [Verrucomicrobiaceae bacterium]|nr:hypothetical protein [Verrucomicrobiaceae bacterium]